MPVDVATLVVKVTPKGVASTKAQLKGLKEEGGKAGSAIDGLGKKFAVLGAAVAAAGIAYGIKKMIDLGAAVINTGKMFETLGVQMTTAMGSIAAGKTATDWIEKFTLDTPYQLGQVSTAFIQLKNFGIDPMGGAMQAVADQTSALGGKQETMTGIVLALGKAFSKGKLEGEEWNSLMEKGVPVSTYLSDALGVTESKLLDMRSAGELGREEIELLIEKMGEMTSGASNALMDTFEGKWSNLQDAISATLNEISKAGALDGATDALAAMIDVLAELDPEALQAFGEAMGAFFEAVTETAGLIEDAMPILNDLILFFSKMAKTKFKNMSTGIDAIGKGIAKAGKAAFDGKGAFGQFLSFIDGIDDIDVVPVTELGDEVGEVAVATDLMNAAMTAAPDLTEDVTDASKDLKDELEAIKKHEEDLAALRTTEEANITAYAAAIAQLAKDTGAAAVNSGDLTDAAATAATNTGTLGTAAGTAAVNAGDLGTAAATAATNTGDLGEAAGTAATNAGTMASDVATAATNTGTLGANAATAATNTGTLAGKFNLAETGAYDYAEDTVTLSDNVWELNDAQLAAIAAERDILAAMTDSEAIAEVYLDEIEAGAQKFKDTTAEQVDLTAAVNAGYLAIVAITPEANAAAKAWLQYKKDVKDAAAWTAALSTSITGSLLGAMHSLVDDLASGAFTGLGDAFGDLFGEIGANSAHAMINAFMDEMTGGAMGGWDAYLDSVRGVMNPDTGQREGGMSVGSRAMMGAGGAYGIYQATQMEDQGAAALQGAISGASLGTAILPGIGTAIGAVVGGLIGYFGSGAPDEPTTAIDTGVGGFGGSVYAYHQGYGAAGISGATQSANRQIHEVYRTFLTSWRDLVKQFNDPTLWEGFEFPTIVFDEVEMSLNDAMTYISTVGIPDAMREAFGGMLEAGFADLGVDAAFTEALFREVGMYTGDQQIEAIEAVIGALVGLKGIEGSTFQGISDMLDMSSMDTFNQGASELVDSFDMMSFGFEHMTLSERAREVQNLAGAFGQFEQATLQMLGQIENARGSIDSMFGGMREDIELDAMGSDVERGYYIKNMIRDLMDDLRHATTTEDVMGITSDINKYLGMLRGLDIDTLGGMGIDEIALGFLTRAGDTAQQRLDLIEEQVEEQYDAVRQAALDLGEEFVDLQDIIANFGAWFTETFTGNNGSGDDSNWEDPGVPPGGKRGKVGDVEGDDEYYGLEAGAINGEPDVYGIPKSDVLVDSDIRLMVLSESMRQTSLLSEHSSLLRQLVTQGGRPVVVNIPGGPTPRTPPRVPSAGSAVY